LNLKFNQRVYLLCRRSCWWFWKEIAWFKK